MRNFKLNNLLFVAAFCLSSLAFASTPDSELVEKAKLAVENANDSDWEILAQSAEIYLIKGENIEEATAWIVKSVEINPTAYNLELYGDFLRKAGKTRSATKQYYLAILKAKEANPLANNERLQQKIWELR